MVHQEGGSCAWEAAQHGALPGSAPSSMLSVVGVSPSSTPFLLILPVCFPSAVQVLPVCAAPCCGTLQVCHWNREHTTDPYRPLPAHADAA